MISNSKYFFSFTFKVQDPLAGEVDYTLTQIGDDKQDALNRLRTNLAKVIQDINEQLPAQKESKTK